jgi:uncharacterized repeat protein (TIGR01451 family)
MALAARVTRNRTIERYNRNEMMDRRRICLLLLLWLSPAHADEIRQIRLATNDLVYDRFSLRIYASVPSSAGSGGNSVVPIDPETGSIGSPVFVGSEPGKLALSDDGRYLYVALDGAAAVRRFDLATQTAGPQFSLGSSSFAGPYFVEDMEVLPGEPEAIAVSRRYVGLSPRHAGVAVYDHGVQRPKETLPHTGSNRIEFGASSSRLYGYDNESSDYGFRRMTVDASGVSVVDVTENLLSGSDIDYDDGLIVSTFGRVIDPEARLLLGTFAIGEAYSALVVSDAAAGRVFFLTEGDGGRRLLAFDRGSFLPLGALAIPGVEGTASSLIRWGGSSRRDAGAAGGDGGLAFRTDAGQLFLIRSALVGPLARSADLAVSLSASPDPVVGSDLTYTATVTNRGPDPATGVMLSDMLPVGVTFVAVDTSQGSGTHAAGVVTASLGTLAPGSATTVTLRVRPTAASTWANTVRVTANEPDPDPANNEATATLTARPAPAADLTGAWAGVDQECVRLRTGLQCTLRGTLHLRNPGDRDAPASVIRFFLSADRVPDGQDRPLKMAATGILTSGGTRSIRLSVALPDGIRAGGKYVIAVLDAQNAVPEADEGNNVIVFGPIR